MPKVIWGPKATGSTGNMSEDDFVAYVIAKVGEGSKEWKKNVVKAYNAIKNHSGESGANSKFPHHGKGVCHVSEGKRGRNQGVSVFFTAKGGQIASIIGIGHHIGSRSYEMEWQNNGWDTKGKSFTL